MTTISCGQKKSAGTHKKYFEIVPNIKIDFLERVLTRENTVVPAVLQKYKTFLWKAKPQYLWAEIFLYTISCVFLLHFFSA